MVQFAIAPKQVNSLLYTGSDLSLTPATQHKRAPTIQDRGYPLLTFWRNMDQSAVLPDVYGDIWVLVKFVYNPSSDKSDAIWVKIVSGGGTGPVFSLTPDTGGIVFPDAGGNVNVFGLSSNSAKVVETEKIADDFYIENRAWETAYVVDQNATPGERGTFTSIQAAYNAIVADGVSQLAEYGLILIRPGTYNESFTIDKNTRILFRGSNAEPNQNFGTTGTVINGPIICNSSQNTNFENITLLDLQVSSGIVCLYNCGIFSLSGSPIFGLNRVNITRGELQRVDISGILLSCFQTDLQPVGTFTITNSNSSTLDGCNMKAGILPINLDGSTSIDILNCKGMQISGNTTGLVSVQNTSVRTGINLPNANLRINGLSQYSINFGGNLTELVTQVPTIIYPSSEGNIASRRIVTGTGNVTQWDQYVACRQSGAITLTLTPSGVGFNFFKGQKITIADESGTAYTNPITVLGTINAASSIVIGSNYGSLTLIFDGTNWFTTEYEEAAGRKITIYNFADSGSTWTVDSRTKFIGLFKWDGGAGGGSGRKGATNAAGGGGGGGGGEASYYYGPVSDFPSSALITIGAGGTGGVGQTTDATNGNSGTGGGASSFGSIGGLASNPGSGGSTTTAIRGAGLGVKTNFFSSNIDSSITSPGSGGNGSNTTSSSVPINSLSIAPTGGGGGGGANSINERAGQAGGSYISGTTVLLTGGTEGLESTGINGGNGNPPIGLFPTTSATGLYAAGTGGGGGGGYSIGAGGATTGGRGGDGSVPGGGGGGGGGGLSGIANSGAGGDGGAGRIIVIEYF